jgi:HAD superfamily hydrolase (TIGR01509 family)
MEVQLTSEIRKLTVDAVMFDLDGTLIDSVPIYYEIIDIVFAELGVPAVSRKTLLRAMDNGDFDWDCVLPDSMRKDKDKLTQKARQIIDKIGPPMFRQQVRLIPGTEATFQEIAAAGIKTGLVTSTPAQQMAVKMVPLINAGLDEQLESIVTTDDVRHKKPAAEPLILCSQTLGVKAKRCVYVGDTRVDIRAGKAAGMQTVGVLTGFDDYGALKREKPDSILDSIAQLNEAIGIQ